MIYDLLPWAERTWSLRKVPACENLEDVTSYLCFSGLTMEYLFTHLFH